MAVAGVGARSLTSLLYGVTPLDPPTYFAVIVLLGLVCAAACWLPAWRAASVDPSTTLKIQ